MMVSSDIGQQEPAPAERGSTAESEPDRRAARWPAWATILILVVLAVLWLSYRFYLLGQYEQDCISNGRSLQIEINRQLAALGDQVAAGHGTISARADVVSNVELSVAGLTNPFSGQPVGLIAPGDAYRPGDLLVIPVTARVKLSEGEPPRVTANATFQAYFVLPAGLRASKLREFRGYADLDRDGVADPLLGCFGGMSTSGKSFNRTVDFQPVVAALQRQGIWIEQGPRPPLRVNQVPVLRFLLGIGVD